MKIAVAIALAVSFLVEISASAADDPIWKPQASFQLEDADLQKTMLFVSGMAYGLTEYSRELVKSEKPRLFCPPGIGVVSSRQVFEILNVRHAGKKVTAEQATVTAIAGLRERFPCK